MWSPDSLRDVSMDQHPTPIETPKSTKAGGIDHNVVPHFNLSLQLQVSRYRFSKNVFSTHLGGSNSCHCAFSWFKILKDTDVTLGSSEVPSLPLCHLPPYPSTSFLLLILHLIHQAAAISLAHIVCSPLLKPGMLSLLSHT